LVDPAYLPAHEWPRFRQLIRQNAPSPAVTLVVPTEPGEPLAVTGRVLDRAGRPIPRATLYLYQTSAKGWYADRAPHVSGMEGDRRHARLFGYLVTDDAGRFEVRTVRPGGYPRSNLPAHIHVEVERPGAPAGGLITEIQFDDDPRLTPEMRVRSRREGFVIAPVEAGRDRVRHVRVELTVP
jgi:protocatechuate 3,4-dioxygenase beta subunit